MGDWLVDEATGQGRWQGFASWDAIRIEFSESAPRDRIVDDFKGHLETLGFNPIQQDKIILTDTTTGTAIADEESFLTAYFSESEKNVLVVFGEKLNTENYKYERIENGRLDTSNDYGRMARSFVNKYGDQVYPTDVSDHESPANLTSGGGEQ